MQAITDKIISAIVSYLVNQILTKENVVKWINERLDKAVEAAKASPASWDDPIVQKIHDIWVEISGQPTA